jgi:hypothetical protein
LSYELKGEFNWFGLPDTNRRRLIHSRQQINLSNYSAAYAAFVGASSNSSKSFRLQDFLPYGGVWDYFSSPPLDLSPEVAQQVLGTYEDAPNGAYAAIEQILGQIVTIALLSD